ncbi:adenylate cyclase [Maribacter caenipelagi]|uniref:Adenylate cyclase n=1 Tax=Maribacter caenipelagi TaxID=1447781 RepID=A0A4R7DEK8_9FLAO|nr:adenylate/guanylate cyclase domain-containing protein [Maribacter caenipelagi]TDS18912.1 adenylate cyclase [Maribacter caenipelagi]
MGLSPKSKRRLQRILPFGVIWFVIGLFVLFIQEAATGNKNINPNVVITLTPKVFVFAMISVTIIGLLVGAVEILWLGKLFNNKTFYKKIFYKLSFYTFFLVLTIIIVYPFAASIELGLSPLNELVLNKLSNFLISLDFLSTLGSIAVSLFVSLFYSEISYNVGDSVLMNFFTGKYHKPIQEKRIFLFCDMKSSTTIAEQLGHIEYFKLLKAYYSDFTNAIINHSGAVYQYVGDEIIISWKFEEGIKNNNWINCFLAMKQDLHKKANWYKNNFGLEPTFKSGFHVGEVTTGEIGTLKKEIIFTGDVLNTTARIQGLCNSHNVDILISEELIKELKPDNSLEVKSKGIAELKGKEQKMELFTVSRSS